MELDKAGMIDGPYDSADPGLPVRLEKLRARNAAWRRGPPLHRVILQIPKVRTTVWHCTGGFLLYEEGWAEDDMQLKIHRPAPDTTPSGGLKDWWKFLSAWKPEIPDISRIRSCSVNPEEDMIVITKHVEPQE